MALYFAPKNGYKYQNTFHLYTLICIRQLRETNSDLRSIWERMYRRIEEIRAMVQLKYPVSPEDEE